MSTLHLISHTHWDREWYRPFQEFRLNLVSLVDGLLDLLRTDPGYRHFMLDGQTVVLEDILDLRPELEVELRGHIQSGRILIGPWHILPDEFLVSPEATIRNLLLGAKTARRFGPRMPVGYLPDTFGHIAQMPQILHGFGLSDACVWRGVDPVLPSEFWWQAPDGSRVLTAFLRFSYSNAAFLYWPAPELAGQQIKILQAGLQPGSLSGELLLMHGNDHMLPPRDTVSNLEAINQQLDGTQLVHSTLPAYFQAVHARLAGAEDTIPVSFGEQRCSKGAHLLPGVLSARMWIKQRNHACENLLERWAEPFSTLSRLTRPEPPAQKDLQAERLHQAAVDQAWWLLMECHPHDSICGCSVDQVHAEMVTRFDQVEQIGEKVVQASLRTITSRIDTAANAPAEALQAVTVFNPSGFTRTDIVNCQVDLHTEARPDLRLIDQTGRLVPMQVTDFQPGPRIVWKLDRVGLVMNLGRFQENGFDNLFIRGAAYEHQNDNVTIRLKVTTQPEPDMAALSSGFQQALGLLQDPTLNQFTVIIEHPAALTLQFVAREVPGIGYRTYWLQPATDAQAADKEQVTPDLVIENEFFRVEPAADGTVSLLDKQTGNFFEGLNRFVDGGEVGDEYNYCPPDHDELVSPSSASWTVERGPTGQHLTGHLVLQLPNGLSADRKSRADGRISLNIITRLSLSSGVRRLDIHSQIHNPIGDHRLRVHFPTPILTNRAYYDSHFAVLERPLSVPEHDSTWMEAPRPELPQRGFTCLSDGASSLAVTSRGLPEVEVRALDGGLGTEIFLTLLRCVGWLSRDDLSTRRGHAGPGLPTPGAQMVGSWSFDYSLIFELGGWETVLQPAAAFDTPLRVHSTALHVGPLADQAALVEISPSGFLVSSLKTAQDREQDWVLRGYNPTPAPLDLTIRTRLPYSLAARSRMDETILQDLPGGVNGCLSTAAAPYQVVTVRFNMS